MNLKKAKQIANNWIERRPGDLEPAEVQNVLEALGFEFIKQISNHTTFLYKHDCLIHDGYFTAGILSYSIRHAQGQKKKVIGKSLTTLIRALECYIQFSNNAEANDD